MAKRLWGVFGGGCDMVNGVWGPMGDFEIWPLGPNGGRSLTRQPFDDENPNSVVSMGELILEAGIAYYDVIKPDAVAIAYGDSSPSLKLAGHPSENEVMSQFFRERVPEAHLEIFDPIEWNSGGKFSGTYHEAANLLRLCQRDGFDELFILARGFHARAHAFTAIRLREPEFQDLNGKISITPLTVESVLREQRPGIFDERIERIEKSRSVVRSLFRECNALMNFNKGTTQVIQPPAQIASATK